MQDCTWCSPDINIAKSRGDSALCGCCLEHFSLPLNGPIQKHLDGLPFPVLGIELYAGKRMITRVVNRSACTWLSMEPGEIIQHLAGNFLGCIHARLPEGCGAGSPCETCPVLRSVIGTVQTGETLVAAPAILRREDAGQSADLMLRITTMKAGGLVLLRLDRQVTSADEAQTIRTDTYDS